MSYKDKQKQREYDRNYYQKNNKTIKKRIKEDDKICICKQCNKEFENNLKNRDLKGRFVKEHKVNIKYCKLCYRKRRKKYMKEYTQQYRKNNLGYFKEHNKNWKKDNKEREQYEKEYKRNNSEIIKQIQKRRYQKNKERR